MKRRLSVAVATAVAATSITVAPAMANESSNNPSPESEVNNTETGDAAGSSENAAGYAVAGVSGVLGAAVAIAMVLASDPRGIEKAANMFGIQINLPFQQFNLPF